MFVFVLVPILVELRGPGDGFVRILLGEYSCLKQIPQLLIELWFVMESSQSSAE